MSIKNISLKSKNIRGEKESMFVKKKKKVTAENDHSQSIIIVQSINFSTQEGLKGRYTAIAKAENQLRVQIFALRGDAFMNILEFFSITKTNIVVIIMN